VVQKVDVRTVCDVHDEDVEAAETVSFALDGTSYELDACEEHAAEMRDAFAPYVGSARKAGRPSGGGPARRPSRGSSRSSLGGGGGADRERVQAIREWARANGYKVSERGRLSAEVQEAYDRAH
jgi:hypothetical protein